MRTATCTQITLYQPAVPLAVFRVHVVSDMEQAWVDELAFLGIEAAVVRRESGATIRRTVLVWDGEYQTARSLGELLDDMPRGLKCELVTEPKTGNWQARLQEEIDRALKRLGWQAPCPTPTTLHGGGSFGE